MPTSSARNVSSSAPSLMTSGKASLNCGFFTLTDMVPRRKPPTCTVTVCFDEFSSEPVHDAFTTFLVQTCNDVSNRAITIHLWVRQKLQRIDQVVTQPRRSCMRFEDFRCVCIGADLCHQYPVGRSPVVLAAAHAAHHQLHCFFFLLLPSPCPDDTHDM